MTITLGWWLIPAIVTLGWFVASIKEDSGDSFCPPILWLVLLPAPLIAWLTYFVIF